MANSITAFTAPREYTAPVGLEGELTITARVDGLRHRSIPSGSRSKPFSSSKGQTTGAPCARTGRST